LWRKGKNFLLLKSINGPEIAYCEGGRIKLKMLVHKERFTAGVLKTLAGVPAEIMFE
jgi:hypothetical protein